VTDGLGHHALSHAVVSALVKGETIIVFAARGSYTEGDEFNVVSEGPTNPDLLKAAYRRTAMADPHVSAVATVTAVHPANMLDPIAGASRHVFVTAGTGDLVVVRIGVDAVPVLSDAAFTARSSILEGAVRG
jgi:hypothetical protein